MGLFSNMFGQKDKQNARRAQKEARNIASGVAAQAAPLGQQYDQGAAQSFGANAGEYMRNAQTSARGLADEQGRMAATSGTRAATQAARTGGLNKGQAALSGAQRAGDIYSGVQQGAMQQGIGNYMAGTGQIAGQGAEMANRQLGSAGVISGIGAQQQQAGTQQAGSTMGMIGGLAGAAATALRSDERSKENIEPAPDLRSMLDKVRAVSFDYKGGEPGKVGVIAQDLEKGPLDGAVVDTPEGKMIDAPQLTGANTAMIKALYERVKALEAR